MAIAALRDSRWKEAFTSEEYYMPLATAMREEDWLRRVGRLRRAVHFCLAPCSGRARRSAIRTVYVGRDDALTADLSMAHGSVRVTVAASVQEHRSQQRASEHQAENPYKCRSNGKARTYVHRHKNRHSSLHSRASLDAADANLRTSAGQEASGRRDITDVILSIGRQKLAASSGSGGGTRHRLTREKQLGSGRYSRARS